MKITLKNPELTLEVVKVDTPTGVGWCVMLPEERKVLVKYHQGKWQTTENISEQFLQAIGAEIDCFIESNQPERFDNGNSPQKLMNKRPRLLKYFLM
jgi:hypothetical protein